MTPTLLDLALKAGFSDPIEGWMGEAYEKRLERFAALVASAEREACAYRAGIALLGADRGLTNRVDQALRARNDQ